MMILNLFLPKIMAANIVNACVTLTVIVQFPKKGVNQKVWEEKFANLKTGNKKSGKFPKIFHFQR